MPRTLIALILAAAGLLAASPALASGDFTCEVDWTLKLTQFSDCDNQPFLSPGNDSRVNLQLLLLDAGKASLHPAGPPKSADARWPDPDLAGASPFTLGDLDDLIVPPPPSGSDDGQSDRADGEGSRCDSNGTGGDAFDAALAASPAVPPDERAALLAARGALQPTCADDPGSPPAPLPPVQARSALGKQFAAYLAGADAFYGGRYDAAAQSFGGLRGSQQPWLRETARYMLGRVAVNSAQAGAFDQYGVLQAGKTDAKALAVARAAFEAYLRDYPHGAYAASARGLLRRVDWLGGQAGDFAAQFAQAFDADQPGARNVTEVDLVQEADAKLLSGGDMDVAAIREPTLLAAYDLLHMRDTDAKADPKLVTRAALESQQPVFADHAALFDYLRAAHAFYVEGAPAVALALLPAAPPRSPMSYLGFSQQVLHGLALEATGDQAGARGLWLALAPLARPPFQHAAIELGLAMNYERGGLLERVFAAGSPISDPDLREILLRHAAGPALLRQQARAQDAPDHERRVALYALLYKELTRGRYQGFLSDVALLPAPPPQAAGDNQAAPDPDLDVFLWDGKTDESYACPPLRAVAQALAADAGSPAALVCLDEFIRYRDFDGDSLDTPPPADQLGGAPSQFPGGPYSRLESYEALLASARTPPAVRAYVLYRAVECYGPSGYNHCAGKDVPLAQRKAWFQALKSGYPASTWAQQLKYYW